MSKKLTLVEKFTMVRDVLEEVGRNDLVEFIDGRIDLTAKKNASGANGERKLTETQKANIVIKDGILEWLPTDGQGFTVGDMIKNCGACAGLSSSKVTALVTQLVNADKVVRTEVKGRAYFKRVAE